MNLFIVIPAFNEGLNIKNAILDCLRVVDKDMVVVVDDGSADNTYNVARELGVNVLRHKVNRGQGASLYTGTLFALERGAQFIAHFDGDAQFDATDILKAVNILREGCVDAVLGSRFLRGASNASMPLAKRIMLKTVARLVNFILTGVWLSDAHNGFRVLTSAAARSIDVQCDRMAHNSEIVRALKRGNLRFVEMPVKVSYREFGQGVVGGFKILKEWLVGKFV